MREPDPSATDASACCVSHRCECLIRAPDASAMRGGCFEGARDGCASRLHRCEWLRRPSSAARGVVSRDEDEVGLFLRIGAHVSQRMCMSNELGRCGWARGTCERAGLMGAKRHGRVRAGRGQSLADAGEFGGAISMDRRWTMRRDERTIGKGPVREQHRARTEKTWPRRASGTSYLGAALRLARKGGNPGLDRKKRITHVHSILWRMLRYPWKAPGMA